jgi:TPR repeat protein
MYNYTNIIPTTHYQESIAQMEIGAYEFYCMGNRSSHGNGVRQDKQVAFQFYMMAARKMYAPAQCTIGICFKHGIGVDRDAQKAADWFLKGAQQGHARSQYNMGLCLAGEQDNQQAIKWIGTSATRGHTMAQRKLVTLVQARC